MSSSYAVLWLLAVLSTSLISNLHGVDYRLDRSVLPSFYNLTLTIEPGETAYKGSVDITLKTQQENVTSIRLHQDTLEIVGCWLQNTTGSTIQSILPERLEYEAQTQQLVIPLDKALLPNVDYVLNFIFLGKIRTDMAGLFSASYVDELTNSTKWLALTQMQRLNARLVFPCFDEPSLKARFQLQIVRQEGFTSISNTRLNRTTHEGDIYYMDHFEPTPPMSTYLLAFIVSQYEARGNLSEFAVVSRPEYYNNTRYSFEIGEKVLAAYDELFQEPYKTLGNEPLLYASSPRFPHNGMENWGLIIYSDAVLVHHEGYTDGWKDKEFSLRIIAHETSHMWFGDSVTFEWWSYFWLNEAFARYYEYFMAHQLSPEYQLDQQFVVRQVQLIMITDSRIGIQSMTSAEDSVNTPSEIANKFSSIAYAKGASIVRMWRNLMGGDNFDEAIRGYLKQHHLGNTEPKHLFAHLREQWPAEQDVQLDQFFYDFTEQPGYPMITVNITEGNRLVTLHQKRFLISATVVASETDLRYTLPITFATNVDPNFRNLTPYTYFKKSENMTELRFDEGIEWIVLNLQQSNYYRVFYDTPILQKIQLALSQSGHSSIAVENRAQLVDDLFNFAHAEIIDYVQVFQFLEYLSTEVDYIVWYAAYQGMDKVVERFNPQQLVDFQSYLGDISSVVFRKLSVNTSTSDSILDVYNRNLQVSWLCKYRIHECNEQVLQSFSNSLEKPSPDYRETFYCAASRSTGYTQVLLSYTQETNSDERELLWRAASCTRDYRKHYQNEILTGSSDVNSKTIGLAQLYEQNPDLVTPIFLMVTENITQLAEALNSWPKTAEALRDMSDYMNSDDDRILFEKFYTDNHVMFGESASVLLEALGTMKRNYVWASYRLDGLAKYLKSRNGAASAQILTTTTLLFTLGLSLLGTLFQY